MQLALTLNIIFGNGNVNLEQLILRTDAAGMPVDWIDYRQAAKLIALEQVSYTCGDRIMVLHGGINAASGLQRKIEINSIVSTRGQQGTRQRLSRDYVPPLYNVALFRRDDHFCMYCGQQFDSDDLSRDHVTPLSQGGNDSWNNVVTACRTCNNLKAGKTPEEARMKLLAIPFVPTHSEYVYLQGHNILADQMAFLRAHFPRSSRLRARNIE